MDCPKCLKHPMGDYWASVDRLWCNFEAEVIDGYLNTVYYCRHCDWNEQKKFDPQEIHNKEEEE